MRKILNDLWNTLEDYKQLKTYGYKCDKREYYVPETISADDHAPVVSTATGITQMQTGNASIRIGNNGPDSLEKINKEILQCRDCKLCTGRKNSVAGAGVLNPLVMVIGEAPGAEEDSKGLPFAGEAGEYLDKWLKAISLDRETNCFLVNIVKCMPQKNREPQLDEIELCKRFLKRQIALLKPKVILAAGRLSGSIITGRQEEIGKLRGSIYSCEGIPVVVTYHPGEVLQDRRYRSDVWEDLKILRKKIDEIT